MPALDGVRGIAVGLVLLYHFYIYEQSYTVADPRWLLPAVKLFNFGSSMGWVGVEMFFVLSGFLITGILVDSKGGAGYFRWFYARRALRILPIYYAVLLIHVLAIPHTHPPAEVHAEYVVAHQAWYWAFLTNFLFVGPAGWNRLTGHFWTLAVEEQFYLVWPLVVWALDSRRLRRVCLWILIAGPVLRVLFFVGGVPGQIAYLLTPTDIDGLATGAFIALAFRDEAAHRFMTRYGRRLVVSAVIALCVLIVARRSFSLYDSIVSMVGFSAMAIAFGALTYSAASANGGARFTGVLRNPILRFLGRYSYAIYLLHMSFIQLWRAPQRAEARFVADGVPPLMAHLGYMVVVTTAVVLTALVSWFVLEQPFLKLRPGRARAV